MPAKATAVDELLDALQQVPDLDALHSLLSNETIDRFAPPQFATWLIDLINAERGRRESPSDGFTDYPMHEFTKWPPVALYAAATITMSIVEAALMIGRPAMQNFAMRLHQVMVGSMGIAYLEAVEAWQLLRKN